MLGYLAALWTMAGAGITRVLDRRGVRFLPVDLPGPRKDHPSPALLGGILLLPVFCLAVASALGGVSLLQGRASALLGLAGLLLATATGWIDDHRKDTFPWGAKLAGQTAAACLGAIALGPAGLGELALRVLWLVGLQNAFNFIDNSDGVALTVVLVPAACLALFGPEPTRLPAACIAGACAGLLPHNWPKPHVFLGDCGSHALGYAMGILTLALATTAGAAGLLLPVAEPLVDLLQVVAVRVAVGQRPWVADHRHLAHRALAAGVAKPLLAPFAGLAAAAAVWPCLG